MISDALVICAIIRSLLYTLTKPSITASSAFLAAYAHTSLDSTLSYDYLNSLNTQWGKTVPVHRVRRIVQSFLENRVTTFSCRLIKNLIYTASTPISIIKKKNPCLRDPYNFTNSITFQSMITTCTLYNDHNMFRSIF